TKELFLEDLRTELMEIRSLQDSKPKKARALRSYLERLSHLNFLDAACGCGNFLAIAYRELRRLETDAILELQKYEVVDLNSPQLSQVDVDQLFGIESHSYSARIAESALWMTDHLLNADLGLRVGTVYQRLPLRKSPRIVIADALEIAWDEVVPADRCSYILGNPPYKGAKAQSALQRRQIRKLAGLGVSGGTLDFVCGWFLKAARYARPDTRIAFVATNSIVSGEQVGQLWPKLLGEYGRAISFAHQPFHWKADNANAPAVHVVIVGLDSREHARATKALYTYSG